MTEKERLQQKENHILKLEKEVEKWKKAVKTQRYGLVWLDVPEAFEDDVENKLPILEEVPKKAIKNKDEKPTHLLIEGDNYHALTCLNYTHKEKIDVIYIDPPYNTGTDGFRYKDKRILDQFPDGTEVPKDHAFRHGYWLSFMKKRLELSKDLLKDKGIIFISIDDNEHAQLRLLCDSIFYETNFIGTITWEKRTKAQNTETAKEMLQSKTEYILVYRKGTDKAKFNLEVGGEKIYDQEDEQGLYRLKKVEEMYALGIRGRETMIFPIEGVMPRKGFQWKIGKDQIAKYKNNEGLLIIDVKPYLKIRPEEETSEKFIPFWSHFFDKDTYGTSEKGKSELTDILGTNEHEFETVKPVNLIKKLLFHINKKDCTVLDFFAGSGTTGHAVMELNKRDKGTRQVILVTSDENKIMKDICYPRIKRVISGYDDVEGLGNSFKYYKTSFVGKHNILDADDKDKIQLAHHAGEMLAIAENTLEQVKKNDHWQVFENRDRMTAVYFREEQDQLDVFVKEVLSLKKPVTVYMFSWEEKIEIADFEDDKNISLKTIPQPILEIYKQIYNII